MTKKEAQNYLVKKICEKEGKKKQALDAGQAREVLLKLKQVLDSDEAVDAFNVYIG